METVITTVALIIAAVAVFAAYRKNAESLISAQKRSVLESEIENRDRRIAELEKQAEQSIADREKVIRLETEIRKEREGHEREIKTLMDSEQRLTEQFENIGNKIFDDKSKKFKEQNKEGLENILTPLKEDIKEFKESFTKTDKDFSGKFGELKNQIEELGKLNKTIGEEAQNLTKALKGDSKRQGNWGELVLEKTLEISGLREGRDYEKQESFSGRDGERRIVDVIVRLPDGKDIVIDSKVSLTDYERYNSSDNESDKARFLKEHLNSVEKHCKDLGEKDYRNLRGVRTLNFVLMFIPIEPAYILAVKEKEGIFQKALDRNVVLVCPSTLLAVLRTVHSLWQMEDRNTNAQKIAEEAGNLYDKFAGFVDQMEKMDKQLGTVRNTFETAYNLLSRGRGNLVGRAEKMKELGAKTSKALPAHLVGESENGNDENTEGGTVELP